VNDPNRVLYDTDDPVSVSVSPSASSCRAAFIATALPKVKSDEGRGPAGIGAAAMIGALPTVKSEEGR
jgi:hypothetical protein